MKTLSLQLVTGLQDLFAVVSFWQVNKKIAISSRVWSTHVLYL